MQYKTDHGGMPMTDANNSDNWYPCKAFPGPNSNTFTAWIEKTGA